jgi:hypothetical protein
MIGTELCMFGEIRRKGEFSSGLISWWWIRLVDRKSAFYRSSRFRSWTHGQKRLSECRVAAWLIDWSTSCKQYKIPLGCRLLWCPILTQRVDTQPDRINVYQARLLSIYSPSVTPGFIAVAFGLWYLPSVSSTRRHIRSHCTEMCRRRIEVPFMFKSYLWYKLIQANASTLENAFKFLVNLPVSRFTRLLFASIPASSFYSKYCYDGVSFQSEHIGSELIAQIDAGAYM